MSNNAFSFADELRVNSKLRGQFAQLCTDVMGGDTDTYEDDIERYGAEDLVVEMVGHAPAEMEAMFGVR